MRASVFADPLVIFPLRVAAESDWGEFSQDLTNALVLAPDARDKAHAGGERPYSMAVPNLAADGLFSWASPTTTFVEYLRRVFDNGGFPGWEFEEARPQKEIDFLKAGLLAL